MWQIKIFFLMAVITLIGIKADNDTIFDKSESPVEGTKLTKSEPADNITDTESSGDEELSKNFSNVSSAIDGQQMSQINSIDTLSKMSSSFVKDIRNKKITILSTTVFGEGDLNDVNTLLADDNEIKTIDKEIFKNLPNLVKLSMTGNQIQHLETEIFSEATKLNELNLDKNPLQLPEDTHFLTTTSLRKFSMSECKLKIIKEDTFNGMTGLEELDIGKNPIEDKTPISKALFEPLSNLSKLIIPAGSPDELIKEVCKTHALLQKICLDECDLSTDRSCSNQEVSETEQKIVSNSEPEDTPSIEKLSVSTLLQSEVNATAQTKIKAGVQPEIEIVAQAETKSEIQPEVPIVAQAETKTEIRPEIPIVAQAETKTKEQPEVPVVVQAEEQAEKQGKAPVVEQAEETIKIQAPASSETLKPISENADETTNLMKTENNVLGRKINTKTDDQIVELESSKSDVTNQGPNGPAIGVIIGVIVIIVMGIIVKKNWRKIKSKWNSNNRNTPAPKSGQNVDRIRQPEEVPLKSNNTEADNPV